MNTLQHILLVLPSLIFCGIAIYILVDMARDRRRLDHIREAQEWVLEFMEEINGTRVKPEYAKMRLIQLRERMTKPQIQATRINLMIRLFSELEKEVS